MGADGGTIPKRCELIKKKKKSEKLDKNMKNAAKWRTCQMSQQKLKKPIVADRLGRMYSKEAVIEAILNKTIPQSCVHIKGMKASHYIRLIIFLNIQDSSCFQDVKELRLTDNKDFKDTDKKGGDAYDDANQV